MMRGICPKCGSTSVLIHDASRNKCTDCGVVYSESDDLRAEVERLTADGCKCQGCGTMYTLDVSVPDETWERIKPEGKPEGAGLLCPQCVADRLVSERDRYKAALEKVKEDTITLIGRFAVCNEAQNVREFAHRVVVAIQAEAVRP